MTTNIDTPRSETGCQRCLDILKSYRIIPSYLDSYILDYQQKKDAEKRLIKFLELSKDPEIRKTVLICFKDLFLRNKCDNFNPNPEVIDQDSPLTARGVSPRTKNRLIQRQRLETEKINRNYLETINRRNMQRRELEENITRVEQRQRQRPTERRVEQRGDLSDLSTLRRRINGYRFVRKLSEGTFGEVFYALDRQNNPVAIKKFKADQRAIEDMRKESDCLQRIQTYCNEYAVCKKDEFTHLGKQYVVIDYIKGKNMYDIGNTVSLDKRKSQYQEKLLDLIKGLYKIHSDPVNTAHQDIKGQNIMFDENLNVFRYIDWGGCCYISNICGYSGTLIFSPPELIEKGIRRGAIINDNINYNLLSSVIKRSSLQEMKAHDIWSLGVVFLRFLTVQSRDFDNYLNYYSLTGQQIWDMIRYENSGLNKEIIYIIKKLLTRNMNNRLTYFKEIAEKLIRNENPICTEANNSIIFQDNNDIYCFGYNELLLKPEFELNFDIQQFKNPQTGNIIKIPDNILEDLKILNQVEEMEINGDSDVEEMEINGDDSVERNIMFANFDDNLSTVSDEVLEKIIEKLSSHNIIKLAKTDKTLNSKLKNPYFKDKIKEKIQTEKDILEQEVRKAYMQGYNYGKKELTLVGLSKIPKNLHLYVNHPIKKLVIEGTLTKIENLETLDDIVELYLPGNFITKIENIPEGLETLDLSGNPIENIEESQYLLENIPNVILNNNNSLEILTE